MSNTIRYLTGPNTDHVTLSGPFIMRVWGGTSSIKTGRVQTLLQTFSVAVLAAVSIKFNVLDKRSC